MSQPLLILGTGGSVHDVLDIVEAINRLTPTWEVIGFLDDARPVGSDYLGHEILGPLCMAERFYGHAFVNAIGSDQSFRRLPEILGSTGLKPDEFATLIHPNASVSSRAYLGRGVRINYGVCVGGGVSIGNHVVLCPGAIVGHNSTVEDYSIVAPGALISGYVHVGRSCYIGAGGIIRQHLRIEERSLIGMGAVVLGQLDAGSVVVGNPARSLIQRNFRSLTSISEVG